MGRELYAILWGATWGNNAAWLESLAATGLVVWGFRDHIGRHLAAWWARHHGPHAVAQHREALRQHAAEGIQWAVSNQDGKLPS